MFPSIAYVSLLTHHGLFIEAFENYQKRSFRNRYCIQDSNGIHELSIPLMKGKNQQQAMQSVQISYSEDWPRAHLQSLQTAYGKTPFYNYYKDEVKNILLSGSHSLFEFNMMTIDWLKKRLGLENKFIQCTERYNKVAEDQIIDLRSSFQIRFNNSKNLIQDMSNLDVTINPWISSLDLLFQYGPESVLILNKIFPKIINS